MTVVVSICTYRSSKIQKTKGERKACNNWYGRKTKIPIWTHDFHAVKPNTQKRSTVLDSVLVGLGTFWLIILFFFFLVWVNGIPFTLNLKISHKVYTALCARLYNLSLDSQTVPHQLEGFFVSLGPFLERDWRMHYIPSGLDSLWSHLRLCGYDCYFRNFTLALITWKK